MQDWINTINELSDLSAEWKREIEKRGQLVSVPAGITLFAPGKPAENMVFLISGSVKVQQMAENGREIVLYRIEAGESCIMTTACLMGHAEYSAEGISESPVTFATLPKSLFDELVANAPIFREFVFATFSKRMIELLMMINDVAFRRMDIRLAERLIELSKETRYINITHQELATELGTAREVISRQLQEFQKRDWIVLARGVVEITDLPTISKFARSALP